MRKFPSLLAVVLLVACSNSHPLGRGPSPLPPGPLGDTWIGDGAKWEQEIVPGPVPRYFAALAYDAPRHMYVLFGGQAGAVTMDDTWTWDGAKWTQMSPAHKPPPRRNAAMAYDPSHQAVVMHGGLIPDQAEGFESSDTWTWNGSDWTEVSVESKAIGPRQGLRMVTAGNGVLLFGGNYANLRYYADVWTWDGAGWSRIDRNPTPPGRGNAAITWDPLDSALFVYGGAGINSQAGPGALGKQLNDVWVLRNGAWTQLRADGPPTLANGNAFWNQKTNRLVVVFGIKCPDPTNEDWVWAGASWTQSANVAIPARWGAAIAEDPGGNVVVFGGSDEPGC